MIKKMMAAVIIALGSCVALQAQIAAKSILLGGEFGYDNADLSFSSGGPKEQSTTANFNISVGKALKANAVFGITAGYSPSTLKNYYNGSYYINATLKTYNLGVFYRQYITLAKNFYFFTEAGAGYNSSKQVEADTGRFNTETLRQNGGHLSLMPGIAYKITKRLFIEIVIPNFVNVQYLVTTDKLESQLQTQSAKEHQFIFNSSLNSSGLNSLGVGFRFVL